MVVPQPLNSCTERHRDGVLEVGASHLQDILELLALGEESIPEPAQLFHVAFQPQDQTEVEGRRVDVVRGLPEVHMVVRIDVLVLALLVAEALEGEVRDHLVGVHVAEVPAPPWMKSVMN